MKQIQSSGRVDPKDAVSRSKRQGKRSAMDGFLFYSIWGTNDTIGTSGGIPYDNGFRIYFGSTNAVALNRGVDRIKGNLRAEKYGDQHFLPPNAAHLIVGRSASGLRGGDALWPGSYHSKFPSVLLGR
jgi:hypothetical protein